MSIPLPMRFENEPLLWTVEGVYSPEECAGFIRLIEDSAPTLAANNPLILPPMLGFAGPS